MEEGKQPPTSSASENGKVEILAHKLAAMQLKSDHATETDSLTNRRLLDLLNRTLRRPHVPERNHVFWNTQPVCKFTDEVKPSEIGPIDANSNLDRIRSRPYTLPDAFEWFDIDVFNEEHKTQLYTLLNENYVEDDENLFRFDYKPRFLQWAMTPPGYKPDWHIGVRVKSSKRMVGFISGIPAKVNVLGTDLEVAEINFLCVHKQLRSKRLAPVLIKEVTRRVNLCNIWQAVYTAGVVIPKPIATCRYWHRPLNIRKLVNSKFSSIGNRMTISRAQRLYKLPPESENIDMRPMESGDAEGVLSLLESHLVSYKIHPVYTRAELLHVFLPKDDIIYSYVKTDEAGTVTDLLSFYCLASSVIGNPKIGSIKAAYSYYNIATTMTFKALMERALHLANSLEFDVFNALDLMGNDSVFEELKFGEGDGDLHYYLYNWRIPTLSPPDVGIVLL